MPYFSEMPTFDYPDIVKGKYKFVNARNILVRAKIIDYIKNTQSAYINYTIKDGERPEHIAYRVYGQSDLHWVILLFNEIIDPLFEWPISSSDLESSVLRRYDGKTLFVNLRKTQYSKNGVLQIANQSYKDIWYEIGGKVTQGNATATVLDWDPDLYKLVIRQDSAASFRVTPGILDPLSQNRDLVHVRSDGIALYSPVGRVVDQNRYSVHHFEDADSGEIQDHHSLLINNNEAVNASILDYYATYNTELIRLPGKDVISVSNYQHEINKNDKKRNIKMMRPDLIDVIIKDMRRIFDG